VGTPKVRRDKRLGFRADDSKPTHLIGIQPQPTWLIDPDSLAPTADESDGMWGSTALIDSPALKKTLHCTHVYRLFEQSRQNEKVETV